MIGAVSTSIWASTRVVRLARVAARRIVSRCLAPLSIKVLYEYLTIMLADRRTSVEAGSELNVGAVIATPSAVTLSGVAARGPAGMACSLGVRIYTVV
jgi:hypothetical protein